MIHYLLNQEPYGRAVPTCCNIAAAFLSRLDILTISHWPIGSNETTDASPDRHNRDPVLLDDKSKIIKSEFATHYCKCHILVELHHISVKHVRQSLVEQHEN